VNQCDDDATIQWRSRVLADELSRVRQFIEDKQGQGELTAHDVRLLTQAFREIVHERGGLDTEGIKADAVSYGLVAHGLAAMKQLLIEIEPSWTALLNNRRKLAAHYPDVRI
jgi:hypothetical protein